MSNTYETVIGLEVHCELATQSKLLCGCRNAFGAPPNTLCCPVCTGMPGALPALNRQAVAYTVKIGLALECHINRRSAMARKHYFYPDLPKAYQTTQGDVPLCENGRLTYLLDGEEKSLGITRIHLEEDAGKLTHTPAGTLADYNRCGVPLIEVVTEPGLHSAQEAKAAMEAIAQLARYLGVSDVKMQEGSLRADVNVSLRVVGQAGLGPRVEMKNINSFAAAGRAIEYEEARQRAVLAGGGAVAGETRRWDDAKGESLPMRGKEDAPDYRYMPEPDLGTIELDEETLARLRAELPELPVARLRRYRQAYGLPLQDAMLLCAERARADFFDATMTQNAAPAKTVANWLLGEVPALLHQRGDALVDTRLTPANLAGLLALVEAGGLSGSAGKLVLAELLERDAPPAQVVAQLGLTQIQDEDALASIVQRVLAANPKAVADYRAGKAAALGFLVGRCMKESAGRGNPERLRELLKTALENDGGKG